MLVLLYHPADQSSSSFCKSKSLYCCLRLPQGTVSFIPRPQLGAPKLRTSKPISPAPTSGPTHCSLLACPLAWPTSEFILFPSNQVPGNPGSLVVVSGRREHTLTPSSCVPHAVLSTSFNPHKWLYEEGTAICILQLKKTRLRRERNQNVGLSESRLDVLSNP